jgi:hypothetical protein
VVNAGWGWFLRVPEFASLLLGVGWAWAGLAVAAGWLAGACARGAIAGVLALIATTAAYYCMDSALRREALDLYLGEMLRWWLASMLFGAVLGAAGTSIRRPRGDRSARGPDGAGRRDRSDDLAAPRLGPHRVLHSNRRAGDRNGGRHDQHRDHRHPVPRHAPAPAGSSKGAQLRPGLPTHTVDGNVAEITWSAPAGIKATALADWRALFAGNQWQLRDHPERDLGERDLRRRRRARSSW